jgi:hypothetical protein
MEMMLAGVGGGRRWEIRRALVPEWTLLRRGDHAAICLQLDREDGGISPEEGRRPLRVIFSREPNPPQAPEEIAEALLLIGPAYGVLGRRVGVPGSIRENSQFASKPFPKSTTPYIL